MKIIINVLFIAIALFGVIALLVEPVLGLILLVIAFVLYRSNKKQRPVAVSDMEDNNLETKLRPSDSPDHTTRIRFRVMGTEYEGRNERIHSYVSKKAPRKNDYRVLQEENVITLKDEDNLHDPNAIAVYHNEIGMIGYVPRDRTSTVRKFYEKNIPHMVAVRFSEQEDEEYSVVVRLITEVKKVV